MLRLRRFSMRISWRGNWQGWYIRPMIASLRSTNYSARRFVTSTISMRSPSRSPTRSELYKAFGRIFKEKIRSTSRSTRSSLSTSSTSFSRENTHQWSRQSSSARRVLCSNSKASPRRTWKGTYTRSGLVLLRSCIIKIEWALWPIFHPHANRSSSSQETRHCRKTSTSWCRNISPSNTANGPTNGSKTKF